MQVCSNAPFISRRHVWHMNSQCSMCHRKFVKHNKFPSTINSDVNRTHQTQSMATEFLAKPQMNFRQRINNPNASASNINIEGNLLPTQVSDEPGMKFVHWTMPLNIRLHHMKTASTTLMQFSTQISKKMSNIR